MSGWVAAWAVGATWQFVLMNEEDAESRWALPVNVLVAVLLWPAGLLVRALDGVSPNAELRTRLIVRANEIDAAWDRALTNSEADAATGADADLLREAAAALSPFVGRADNEVGRHEPRNERASVDHQTKDLAHD